MKRIGLCLIIILLPTMALAADLSVFAASSLSEALREISRDYQEQHPKTRISLNFAGSQALATQIEQGAPADLFIAANITVIERLHNADLIDTPKLLLHNSLVLAVDPKLKTSVTSITDLGQPNLLLAIGNNQVPIGRYTRQFFDGLSTDPDYGNTLVEKIKQNIVSEENMVKAIIAKLLLGEIDAGIVYRSDLMTVNARQLLSIELPSQHSPQAVYPVARVKAGQEEATEFIRFLFSPESQQIFARQGFQTDGIE